MTRSQARIGGGLGAGAQKDITNMGGLWGGKKSPTK